MQIIMGQTGKFGGTILYKNFIHPFYTSIVKITVVDGAIWNTLLLYLRYGLQCAESVAFLANCLFT